jgi:hypothetical protein
MTIERHYMRYNNTGKQELYKKTDEEMLEEYLTGYIDHYSGGELEHLRYAMENLRRGVAELLLQLHGDKVIALIEEKEVK